MMTVTDLIGLFRSLRKKIERKTEFNGNSNSTPPIQTNEPFYTFLLPKEGDSSISTNEKQLIYLLNETRDVIER
jgi:hypothetical protein